MENIIEALDNYNKEVAKTLKRNTLAGNVSEGSAFRAITFTRQDVERWLETGVLENAVVKVSVTNDLLSIVSKESGLDKHALLFEIAFFNTLPVLTNEGAEVVVPCGRVWNDNDYISAMQLGKGLDAGVKEELIYIKSVLSELALLAYLMEFKLDLEKVSFEDTCMYVEMIGFLCRIGGN